MAVYLAVILSWGFDRPKTGKYSLMTTATNNLLVSEGLGVEARPADASSSKWTTLVGEAKDFLLLSVHSDYFSH